MQTLKEYPDRVYLNRTEHMFYRTAKKTIALLEVCAKLAKTPAQKLGLFKRRNELSRNYDTMCQLIGDRKVEVL